jgi:hypothetical protein
LDGLNLPSLIRTFNRFGVALQAIQGEGSAVLPALDRVCWEAPSRNPSMIGARCSQRVARGPQRSRPRPRHRPARGARHARRARARWRRWRSEWCWWSSRWSMPRSSSGAAPSRSAASGAPRATPRESWSAPTKLRWCAQACHTQHPRALAKVNSTVTARQCRADEGAIQAAVQLIRANGSEVRLPRRHARLIDPKPSQVPEILHPATSRQDGAEPKNEPSVERSGKTDAELHGVRSEQAWLSRPLRRPAMTELRWKNEHGMAAALGSDMESLSRVDEIPFVRNPRALVSAAGLRGSRSLPCWSARQVTLSVGAACAPAVPVLECARVPQ